MANLGEVRVKVVPEFSDEFRQIVEGDAIEKVNAGAALVHAIYHHSSVEAIQALPTPVCDALIRAQGAYGVGIHARRAPSAGFATEMED